MDLELLLVSRALAGVLWNERIRRAIEFVPEPEVFACGKVQAFGGYGIASSERGIFHCVPRKAIRLGKAQGLLS